MLQQIENFHDNFFAPLYSNSFLDFSRRLTSRKKYKSDKSCAVKESRIGEAFVTIYHRDLLNWLLPSAVAILVSTRTAIKCSFRSGGLGGLVVQLEQAQWRR